MFSKIFDPNIQLPKKMLRDCSFQGLKDYFLENKVYK